MVDIVQITYVIDVVKRFSITRLNKAQCYNGDEGFQYNYDPKSVNLIESGQLVDDPRKR